MGFSLSFDNQHTVLLVAFQDRLTEATVTDAYAFLRRYFASHPPCASILDYSSVTDNELSAQAVKYFASLPRAMSNGFLRITVAPNDLMYGLARMFQMLSEEGRPELRVVRSMEEAHVLLGVESLHFLPLSEAEIA
jgi:TRAP-type C4-dicarboxylate transport system substrate-binding protein